MFGTKKKISADQKKLIEFLRVYPHTDGATATKKLGWTPARWWNASKNSKLFDFSGKGWFVKETETVNG
jgi:hypothetical protein